MEQPDRFHSPPDVLHAPRRAAIAQAGRRRVVEADTWRAGRLALGAGPDHGAFPGGPVQPPAGGGGGA
jgi:hypothetical protein